MLIKNCKIVSSQEISEGDILIEGEKIAAVGKHLKAEGEVIDARGKIVMPGVVDAHVHVRDFDEAEKEDYTSASMAALAGGVTTFLEMPNTLPKIDNLKTLKRRVRLGEKRSLVDFGIHLGYSSQIEQMHGVDAPSVKVYMDGLGDDVEAELNPAFHSSFPLTIHCEDPRIIKRNMRFTGDLPENDFLTYADVREKKAETTAVEMVTRLGLMHKKKIHLCHLTTPSSLRCLNRYSTCEVTPHHMLLADSDLRRRKGMAKTNPPLRPKIDVHGLWKAVKGGLVDIIASDHAPHRIEEKRRGVFSAPSGIPNLDVMLRLMLDLVNKGGLKLEDLVRMMCENPAKIFRIESKGSIHPGAAADILILDMDQESVVDPEKFYSKAKFSPFAGRKTKGSVETVILRGRVAFSEDEFSVHPGYGRYLYRQV
jgi:dihydroorotase